MTSRLSLWLILCVALAALATSSSAWAQTAKTKVKIKAKPVVTTVYLVRHAEKDSTTSPEDPALSALGQVRAQALRQTLERRQPVALFTTNTVRTRSTLAPLAAATKLEPQVYDPRRGRDLADLVLKQYAGKSVVVVGHSNNLLSLIDDFGAVPPVDEIGENEYEYLFTVRVADGVSPTVEVRGYGPERKPLSKAKVAPATMAPAVAPMK